MHFFCRFCLSPADKAISLEDLGASRLQSWALRNLGLEVNLVDATIILHSKDFTGWLLIFKESFFCL